MAEKVELRGAFEWTCEKCGTDNFARGITYVPSPEHRDEDIAVMGEDVVHGAWQLAPKKVTCSHCNETFETAEYGS